MWSGEDEHQRVPYQTARFELSTNAAAPPGVSRGLAVLRRLSTISVENSLDNRGKPLPPAGFAQWSKNSHRPAGA